PLFTPARIRGGRLCREPCELPGARARARQALPGQRGDADPRSPAFGVLRFASAGGDTHRAAGRIEEPGMSELTARKCKPCEGNVAPYTPAQTNDMLKLVKGWSVEDGKLVKLYPFTNYHQTMAFVNALAWISHREDHHPDLVVGYNKCR